MGLFNKIGKFLGGIATAIVPGFDTLAKTGMFGDDLQAFAAGPGTPPAALAVASSPAITQSVVSQALARQAVPAPAGVPVFAGGDTVNVPRPFLLALTAEAKKVTYGTYVPPQAIPAMALRQPVTPMAALAARLPVSPALSGARIPIPLPHELTPEWQDPGVGSQVVTLGGQRFLLGGTRMNPIYTPL